MIKEYEKKDPNYLKTGAPLFDVLKTIAPKFGMKVDVLGSD